MLASQWLTIFIVAATIDTMSNTVPQTWPPPHTLISVRAMIAVVAIVASISSSAQGRAYHRHQPSRHHQNDPENLNSNNLRHLGSKCQSGERVLSQSAAAGHVEFARFWTSPIWRAMCVQPPDLGQALAIQPDWLDGAVEPEWLGRVGACRPWVVEMGT